MSNEIKKPGSHTDDTTDWQNEANAYDQAGGGDETTHADDTGHLASADDDPDIRFHSWTSAGYTYTTLTLYMKWRTEGLTASDKWEALVSVDGGSTHPYTLVAMGTNRNATIQQASVVIPSGTDLTQIEVKIAKDRVGGGDGDTLEIYDIWTDGEYSNDVTEQVNLQDENIVPLSPTIKAGAKKVVNLLVASMVAFSVTAKAGAKTTVSLLDQNIVPYATTQKAGAKVSVNLLDQNIVPYAPTTKTGAKLQVNLLDQNIVPIAPTPRADNQVAVNLINQEIVPYASTQSVGASVQVNLLVLDTIPYATTQKAGALVAVNLLAGEVVPYAVTVKAGAKQTVSLLVQDIVPYSVTTKAGATKIVSLLDQKIVPFAPTIIAGAKQTLSQLIQNIVPLAVTTDVSGGDIVEPVNLLSQKIVPIAVIVPKYVLNGLVCYWRMDETGGIVLVDREGNVNMDLNGNYTLGVPGKINTAVEFEDDWDTYAKSGVNPSVLMNLPAFSVEFWIKMYSWETNSPYISGLITLHGSPYYPFIVRFGDTGIPKERLQFITMVAPSTPQKIKANANCSLLIWYHVVCTWDGSGTKQMKMYIDTVLQGEQYFTNSNILKYGISNYLWHGMGAVSGRGLDGVLDEIRIYNRALTQDEVTQNYEVTDPDKTLYPDTLVQKIIPLAVTPEYVPPGEMFTIINPSKSLVQVAQDTHHKYYMNLTTKKFFKVEIDTHREV